ncbi:hypothetical protein V6Z12_A07G132200 [Gossypium hirsutum]
MRFSLEINSPKITKFFKLSTGSIRSFYEQGKGQREAYLAFNVRPKVI